MHKYLFLIITLFICLLPKVGVAKSLEKTSLSLENSLKYTLEHNSDLKIASGHMAIAEARYRQVTSIYKPSLKIESSYIDSQGPSSDTLNFNEAKIVLEQPIFTGGHIFKTVRKAKINMEIAEQNYKNIKQSIIFDLKNIYYQSLLNNQNKVVIEKNINQLKALLTRIEKRHQDKSAIVLDVLKTKADIVKETQYLLELNNETAVLNKNFTTILGTDNDFKIDMKQQLKEPKQKLQAISFYIEKALQSNASIKQAEALVQAKELDVSIQKSQKYPQVQLRGEYGHSGRTSSVLEENWGLFVNADLNLWNWGRIKYEIAESKINLEQEKIELKKVKDLLQNWIHEQYLKIEAQQKIIENTDIITQAAVENLRVQNALYNEGKATILDVLSSQNEYKDAYLRENSNIYNLLTAIAYLNLLSGQE